MLPDGLLEQCLRAMYFAPADKPSYALLADMHGPTEGLEAALVLAFKAGSEWADSVPGSWQELVFSYVNAEEGSDDCMQAWHEMEAAVRHYEAVQRREAA